MAAKQEIENNFGMVRDSNAVLTAKPMLSGSPATMGPSFAVKTAILAPQQA
jgi:hypothetical protein